VKTFSLFISIGRDQPGIVQRPAKIPDPAGFLRLRFLGFPPAAFLFGFLDLPDNAVLIDFLDLILFDIIDMEEHFYLLGTILVWF
jgi:hypothetical protein